MQPRKIDYRKGVSPRRRRTECQKAIRNALRQGKNTFGNLLNETDLSRSTLASHLKEMHKKGEVEREQNPKDYRVTYYSLTNDGVNELRRQEDIEALSSAEFTFLSSKAVAKLMDAFSRFLEPSFREHLFRSVEKDSKILGECVTLSIYSDRPSLGNARIKNYVIELAELAKSSMLSRYVDDPRYLEKIDNLTLVFRFDRDKLSQVKDYLQKVEAEMPAHTPLLKLPDKKNYLENKKKES